LWFTPASAMIKHGWPSPIFLSPISKLFMDRCCFALLLNSWLT
jgi:hypothetical protein